MSSRHSDFDKRMKKYEFASRTYLTPRVPVIIRIDGKAFHTFTRGLRKPFDCILSTAMQRTMQHLCKNIQNCVFGYTQSDEITLVLIDDKKINTDQWFENQVQKICSVAASMATLTFNKVFAELVDEYEVSYPQEYSEILRRRLWCAMFDARVFNIPHSDVCNNLIWRQQDATRNSIQSVGQAHFSAKQLHGKNTSQIQEMLWSEKGINWDKFPVQYKRGSACFKVEEEGRTRWVIDCNPPIFSQCRKYIECHVHDKEVSE